MIREATLIAALVAAAGCSTSRDTRSSENDRSDAYPQTASADRTSSDAYVGAAGPSGAQGARGPTGPAGQTGEPGLAQGGVQGPAGATGSAGEQGARGAQGAQGGWTTGPSGPTGATGATGAQGGAGQTGARGESAAGYAGAAGASGGPGAQGSTGDTGPRGSSMPGPAGVAGRTGATGEQGEQGQTGAQGSTTAGVAGAAGPDGATGPQGPKGETGARGLRADGSIDPSTDIAANRPDERGYDQTQLGRNPSLAYTGGQWTALRSFWFEPTSATLSAANSAEVQKVAAHLIANPNLRIGLDGTMTGSSSDADRLNPDMSDRRVLAVREALIAAGVTADRIGASASGAEDWRQRGRVDLLMGAQGTQLTSTNSGAWDRSANESIGRGLWFDADKVALNSADASTITEIAAYMAANPTARIGIDASAGDGETGVQAADLSRQRVNTVRDQLIRAGVPANRIDADVYADRRSRQEGRVTILVRADDQAAR